MAKANSRGPAARVAWCAVLVAGLAAAAPAGGQQYYYQPAPDYYRNDTAEGTLVGGGLGAVTGAIIGGRGNRGEGALIGAGIGAITGRLLGKNKDQADRQRAALGAAATAQANAQAAQLAITNLSVIEMTRAGLSDDVIIGAIRQRGGRFDLSPTGLITMKQNGVSDRVVAAAQSLSAPDGLPPATAVTPAYPGYGSPGYGAPVYAAPVYGPPVYAAPVRPVVRRRPAVYLQFGGPRYYPRRYRHRW
ncbi:MAG: YMGG-like glycine zipper-containing protein [Planctomycetota bacterium]